MFHVKQVELWRRAARWAGHELDEEMASRLTGYRDWLIDEGMSAGGLGPDEAHRIDSRHIADSLLFSVGFPEAPEEMWDLGSGVGLPGVPLAILFPNTWWRLIDRSASRLALVRRACRILEVENVETVQADIRRLVGAVGGIVSRGSLPPQRLRLIVDGLLADDGVAVIGGSWRAAPHHEGWWTVSVPSHVLDREVWLLIMRRQ